MSSSNVFILLVMIVYLLFMLGTPQSVFYVGFEAVIPVSVTENNGIDIVIDEIIKLSEESVHYFPDDMITDQPEKVLAALRSGDLTAEEIDRLWNENKMHVLLDYYKEII